MKPVEILRYESRLCKCGRSLRLVAGSDKSPNGIIYSSYWRIECSCFEAAHLPDEHEQPSAWADSADDACTAFEAAEILRS